MAYWVALRNNETFEVRRCKMNLTFEFEEDGLPNMFWWTEGNGGCDCNRADIFYDGEQDVHAPVCGNQKFSALYIELDDLRRFPVDYDVIEMQKQKKRPVWDEIPRLDFDGAFHYVRDRYCSMGSCDGKVQGGYPSLCFNCEKGFIHAGFYYVDEFINHLDKKEQAWCIKIKCDHCSMERKNRYPI